MRIFWGAACTETTRPHAVFILARTSNCVSYMEECCMSFFELASFHLRTLFRPLALFSFAIPLIWCYSSRLAIPLPYDVPAYPLGSCWQVELRPGRKQRSTFILPPSTPLRRPLRRFLRSACWALVALMSILRLSRSSRAPGSRTKAFSRPPRPTPSFRTKMALLTPPFAP
ncbi:hypothetical protein BOTBODRAFT_517928 [Botryobasidium botryosum FD-172 SS1]|uniref:Uncharacterized protein n=1 Tax=Botryobasidium botryosum (strain FD-172 SS1) TaxID=930990 RepID=A0A067MSR5_BOTB1|nr:hypothetical protein BOTBODRAFT_517928 [Botryobasidium botryosum FD-172 SS1]